MNNSPAARRSPLGLFLGEPTPRLYDRVVGVLRTRHHSRRTEQAYIHWIRRFIRFHGLLQHGYDIRTEQELLGHKDIQTIHIAHPTQRDQTEIAAGLVVTTYPIKRGKEKSQ
jgi:site-specific recombinase XerC